MLSTDQNPPVLDLSSSCPCELKSTSNCCFCRRDNNNICSLDDDVEKGCDGKQCSHQLVKVVDLLDNQSLAGRDDDNNSLPSFSIRDYVFSKRRKDININWPFSQKTLQLCLKHNVKDVLPPFQSLDSVKNLSLAKSVEDIVNIPNAKHDVGRKLTLDSENIDASVSGKDKIFLSTTTSQSCSNVDPSLPVKTTFFEAENLPRISIEKPESSVPVVESDIQKPIKKCKLIVKLSSNISEPKPSEDLSLNATLKNSGVSETMASKVCPVCKTFTSSSNTTLNAHIDQCLSGESTVKWMENSESSKHRIKPRKTRLMVDIYETALPCTLEDLDRRNGTNWTSNLCVTSQDSVVSGEQKKKTYSYGNIENKNENNNEENAVYIDSNGTKLRILSKFNDPPSSSIAKDDNGPRKLVKKDKTSKLLSCKEKKYIVNKHKVSKCPPEVDNGEKRDFFTEENIKKGGLDQPLRTYQQMSSVDLGMIKQWVVSKRTGPRKKINLEHEKQHPEKTMKTLRVKTNIVSLDKFMNQMNNTNSSILCDETPCLHKRKDDLSCNYHDGRKEYPRLRKGEAVSSLTQNFQGNKIRRKDGPSVRERCTHSPNDTENHVSSQGTKKIGSNISSDGLGINSRMPSGVKEFLSTKITSLDHQISSGDNSFLSLKKKKNLLSVNHASNPKSKKLGKKFLDIKNPRMHYTLSSGEEMLDLRLARRDHLVQMPRKSTAPMEKDFGESLINSVSKFKKKRERFMSQREDEEEDMASKGSDTCESDSYDSGAHVHDNVTSSSSDAIEEVEIPVELEQTSRIADIAFSKSLGSPSFPTTANPYDENCPPEQNLSAEEEIFSVGQVGKYLVSHHTDLVEEMDTDEGSGNYVVDVDPIPIPGPPGSFLPSPGRMGSEELPGSSSLTTCKIQSFQDEHEIADMQSSDSPTSASMVSNFVAARSDSVSFMNLSQRSRFVQHDIAELRIDPSVESCRPFKQERRAEGKPNLDEPASASILKNDQPCCCSRKEGVLQTGPSSYQESLLLRRRTMSSLPVPAYENEEPTCESKKTLAHSPLGYTPTRVSPNSEGSFPSYGDYESPSPSSPNPVLRLMGKNLMVMNKDENLQSSSVDNGGKKHMFHHSLPRAPPVFETAQRKIPAQNFDLSSSHGFKVPTVSRTVQLAPHPSTVMFSSKEYADGVNFMPDRLRPGDFYSRKQNGIIVTDDFPENEPCLPHKSAHSDVSMEPGGSSGQMAWGYDSRCVNPVYGHSLCSGCRIQNANSHVLHSKGKNVNIVEWVYTPECSSVLHPNSFTASSPSTGFGGVKPMNGRIGAVEYIPSLFSIRK